MQMTTNAEFDSALESLFSLDLSATSSISLFEESEMLAVDESVSAISEMIILKSRGAL